MKNKKPSVLSFVKVCAIILVFTMSANLNATTYKSNSALSSELQFTTLNLAFSPISLAIVTVVNNDVWKRGYNDNFKENTGYGRERPKRKRKCCNQPCNHGGNDEPGDNIPLDGGLSLLALGAAAFGVRKLRKEKHDKA
ncbi:hypothetical protein F6U93_11225 [Tamlana haliotis]|uniref:Uncharacterized protein n=1 Tax=Pseudotamlana haliotis TaxID=2614804 RepID=A0A6N6MDH6_9FLAO|nr:hypothetical protein [Tamlana haliotis]KAB1067348.1 hypothetical protein F6U93_11225 [Tamlana haliotis]